MRATENAAVGDREIVEMATAMIAAGASHTEVGEILGMSAAAVGVKMADASYYKRRSFRKSSRGDGSKGSIADLNELIRSVMRDEDLADPHAIASHVMERIGAKDRDYALQLCLPSQVQKVIRGMRQHARKTDQPDPTVGKRREPTVSEMDRMSHHWIFDVDALGLRGHLKDRVKVADEWKLLRDCTCADLYELAADYRRRASGQLGRAEFYEEIARNLKKSGDEATTVGQAAADQDAG